MLYLLISLVLLISCAGGNPLVHTNVGWIEGLEATDGEYSMFMGIPYATVNDSNHFGNAIPHPRFDRIFQAHDDSAICPQVEEFDNTIVGSLDCLHINIYVPHSARPSTNPLPVLIWMYGGYFSIGFHGRFLYGPKYLVRHDVILVTLNYRVGPYGFMCLDIPEVPGNQGLKDQQMAMRWIKDNIYWFGGDLNRITLFGESAGAMATEIHLLSQEESVYRNVILQSGSSLRPQAQLLRDSTPDIPQRIAEQLGFETNDVYEALNFLSTLEPSEVIGATVQMNVEFRPCVERRFVGVENILADYPINLDVPKVNGMPILLGYNNQEQLGVFINRSPEFFDNFSFADRLQTAFDFGNEKFDKMVKIVRQFYIGDRNTSRDVIFDIIDFDSDMGFNHPAERSLKKFLENGAEKVYYYVFSYNGGRNFVKQRMNLTIGGAAHADELGYLFDISYMGTPTLEDQLVIDRITTMWANFAKYSDPTPQTSELLPIRWQPVTRGSAYHYLDIDRSLNLWRRPFHERMVFWDLFYNLYETNQRGFRSGCSCSCCQGHVHHRLTEDDHNLY